MRARVSSFLALILVVAAGSLPVQASSPPIQGRVSGLELCPQSLCGAAVFVGVFAGQVGGFPALGTMAVAVTHEDLPDADDPPAAITGGHWVIQLLNGRKFAGHVTGGTLANNGNDTFDVRVLMQIDSGGVGTLRFGGTLSHQVFPPTIVGNIVQ